MKCSPHRYSWFLALLAGTFSYAQTSPQLVASTDSAATVRSVRGLTAYNGPIVEIISSRPVTPAISKIENPPRLVIDLPNSVLADSKKNPSYRSDEVRGVRVSQFQQSPPVARIVVDLARPVTYTWDAAGNRLMVRLHASQEAAKPAS